MKQKFKLGDEIKDIITNKVKIYCLILNDMRSSNIENKRYIACSFEKEILEKLLESEKADSPYRDGNWYKIYKKDSVLEWCNEASEFWGQGIKEEWIEYDFNPEEAVEAIENQGIKFIKDVE